MPRPYPFNIRPLGAEQNRRVFSAAAREKSARPI
jgi:hypothetical protein